LVTFVGDGEARWLILNEEQTLVFIGEADE